MTGSARTILLFNKPFDVLSQFTDRQQDAYPNRRNLSHFIDAPRIRCAGRLDRDSEGLLVLTSSGGLQHDLTDPAKKVSKTYWVQVEGIPGAGELKALAAGVMLRDGMTRPAQVASIEGEPYLLWPRVPPIRARRSIPTAWLSLTLTEGRNRQVRRMCAAVGYPVLRLIRYRVGSWTLDGLAPGEVRWVEGGLRQGL